MKSSKFLSSTAAVTLDSEIRSATGRHYCRNPRCGSKLKAPVEDMREAFCARGCHTQYYRKRCIVCEQPMERKRESQQLCKRRKCKSQFAALKAGFLLGRYHPSSHVLDASRNPTKPGTFSRLETDRPWRQVAGPAVDVRLAAIGADDAVKQADRVNRRHWVKAGNGALIQKHHAPREHCRRLRIPGRATDQADNRHRPARGLEPATRAHKWRSTRDSRFPRTER
jgi:hypothetical protein